MHSVILDRVADLLHVIQLLSPIDFEASPIVRQDIPPKTDADACKCVGKRGDRLRRGYTDVALVPAVRNVHEGGQLEHRFPVPPTPQWKARLHRGDERVVAQEGHFTIAAYCIAATE